MGTFHLTDPSGAVYEIEAPDEHAAVSALAQMSGSSDQRPAAEDRGWVSKATDYARTAASGATFGLSDRLAAGVGSLTGGGNYGDILKQQYDAEDRLANEHPVGSAVANIGGSLVAPLGAVGTAAKGVTLGAKALYGALGGGAVGAFQGGLSSRDYTDVAQTAKDAGIGAGVGTFVGGAIPGAARVVGAGYKAAADALRGNAEGMSRGVSRHLVDALIADGPANVEAQLQRLGPDAMLADAGPALLGKAQGASLNSDEGRAVMQSALTARNSGTNARIAGDVERALGPAEDPQTVTNTIRAHRADVDGRNYPRAFESSPPVDTGEVLANLGPLIQGSVGMERRALTNLRDMMMTERPIPRLDPETGAHMIDARGSPLFDMLPSPQTDPAILHKIKGEMDNVIQYDQPGLGIPAAALSRQQGALKHMRGILNDALENQTPGYQRANAASSGLARRGEAVEAGTQYLGSGKTTPSPDRFATEFAQMEPGEQIAFAKGSRGNVDRVLGTKSNDLQALRSELQGEGGWNTAKIAAVHGRDAAERLVGSVDSNLKFRDTYNKVVENSQTAQRQAAAAAMKPTPASETPLINPNMSLTGLAAAGTKKAVNSIVDTLLRRDPTKEYGDVARILSSQGTSRDAAVKSIVEALTRREGNAVAAQGIGNRAALIAAIMESGYARNDPSRKREQR